MSIICFDSRSGEGDLRKQHLLQILTQLSFPFTCCVMSLKTMNFQWKICRTRRKKLLRIACMWQDWSCTYRTQRILFVADPNGALIGGSNMEFLAMPLKKLNHRSTTKVSAYDRQEMKKTIFIAKPNGEIEIKRPVLNRARSKTDQASCKRH